MPADNAKREPAIVQGEFFTDGTKFIFRLAHLPYSGVGDSPSAAFEDLMRVEQQSAPLTSILRQHARDLEGEATRKLIIRWVSIGLIVFAILAGGLVATAALLPKVIADVGGMAITHVSHSLDTMSPEREAELSRAAQRLHKLLDLGQGPSCTNRATGTHP
jgi:hypothetical protein